MKQDMRKSTAPLKKMTNRIYCFVRKFVLEHALKAYKDASSSDEHPDIKYARLLDIADLFQRLLMGRLVAPGGPTNQSTEHGVQHSIAKLMYEKKFHSCLDRLNRRHRLEFSWFEASGQVHT